MRRSAVLHICVALVFVSVPASAQKAAVVNFKFDYDSVITCSRPINLNNWKGSADHGSGVLHSDGTASFDLSLGGSQVHFDGRLGGGPMPAPFGTSRLNVVNRNQLRAVWSLPNNDIIMNFKVAPGFCQVSGASHLRGGAREHNTVILGQLAYCSQLRITRISCTAS
jgi:hypothetical protein